MISKDKLTSLENDIESLRLEANFLDQGFDGHNLDPAECSGFLRRVANRLDSLKKDLNRDPSIEDINKWKFPFVKWLWIGSGILFITYVIGFLIVGPEK